MKNIKRRIIETDLFQMVTARLYQYQLRKRLEDDFSETIAPYRNRKLFLTPPGGMDQSSKYIWMCWWQGRNTMSPLVRECCERVVRFNPDKEVILITKENLKKYVDFPSYILEKFEKGIISQTHMSDLLRCELLEKYGGVWMDATLYTFGPIPQRFYEKNIYTGRCRYNRRDVNVSRNRWTSFFWVSRYPHHILFRFMVDFWHAYWKKQDELIDYLLIDHVIHLGDCISPEIRKELKNVDVNGCGEDLWVLHRNIRKNYSDELIEEIKKKNWMQKLSYKGENYNQQKAVDPEKSVYKVLFLDI